MSKKNSTSSVEDILDDDIPAFETPQTDKTLADRIKDFTRLLDSINSLSDKKKELWKEIYENAITDRQAAFMMFMQLTNIVKGKSTEHAVHGQSISRYIERMSKANDQLIKLAELIHAAEEKSEELNPEDMFDKIQNDK